MVLLSLENMIQPANKVFIVDDDEAVRDSIKVPVGSHGMPVILLTERGDESIRARAHELGVKAYLEKSVANDTLLATIKRVVTQSKPR